MIRNFLFISSIFFSSLNGIKTLPFAEDTIKCTFSDYNEINVDVRVTLAEENNPFQDDEVALEIVKSECGKTSSVTIKRTRILADKSTTVWYGQNTYTGFGDIRYEKSTIEKVPEEFPDFAMFQNYEEKIALVAFGNEADWVWEGFIGNSIIRHVSGNLYTVHDDKFPPPERFNKMYAPMDLKAERKQIVPEILVALDWKSVENKTARDVIKQVIVYYNAVDMLFSQFTSPSIQLNIAGIIIPVDSRSWPYFEKKNCKIEKDHSNECISFSPMLNILVRHFRKYIDVFLPKDYDIVMGMTRLPLCDADGVCDYYGVSFESGICDDVDSDYYAPITGAVRHPDFQGNYFLAAREIGHILGGKYIENWTRACYGGIMSKIYDYQDLLQSRLDWSMCQAHDISTHFREREENYTKCMWNLPKIFEEPESSSITTEIISTVALDDFASTTMDFTTTSTTELTTLPEENI